MGPRCRVGGAAAARLMGDAQAELAGELTGSTAQAAPQSSIAVLTHAVAALSDLGQQPQLAACNCLCLDLTLWSRVHEPHEPVPLPHCPSWHTRCSSAPSVVLALQLGLLLMPQVPPLLQGGRPERLCTCQPATALLQQAWGAPRAGRSGTARRAAGVSPLPECCASGQLNSAAARPPRLWCRSL